MGISRVPQAKTAVITCAALRKSRCKYIKNTQKQAEYHNDANVSMQKRMEQVYKIMSGVANESEKQHDGLEKQKILKAGKLMQQAGLIESVDNPEQVIQEYNKHMLKRIREIVNKDQPKSKQGKEMVPNGIQL